MLFFHTKTIKVNIGGIGEVEHMDFETLVKSRHSAVNFQKDFKMEESDFEQIINLTKLAPSTYNLQPANYLVVMDEGLKDRIYEGSYKQYKIHTASAVVFVLGDKSAFSIDNAKSIYKPMKLLKIMSEEQYKTQLEMIKGYVDPLNKDTDSIDMTKELYLSTIMSSAFFIMSAKSLGYDTCPMHVIDKDNIRNLLNIPEHMEPVLMITIGKSVDKVRQRGYRKRKAEMLTFNRY